MNVEVWPWPVVSRNSQVSLLILSPRFRHRSYGLFVSADNDKLDAVVIAHNMGNRISHRTSRHLRLHHRNRYHRQKR